MESNHYTAPIELKYKVPNEIASLLTKFQSIVAVTPIIETDLSEPVLSSKINKHAIALLRLFTCVHDAPTVSLLSYLNSTNDFKYIA